MKNGQESSHSIERGLHRNRSGCSPVCWGTRSIGHPARRLKRSQCGVDIGLDELRVFIQSRNGGELNLVLGHYRPPLGPSPFGPIPPQRSLELLVLDTVSGWPTSRFIEVFSMRVMRAIF